MLAVEVVFMFYSADGGGGGNGVILMNTIISGIISFKAKTCSKCFY